MTQNLNSGLTDFKTFSMAEKNFRTNLSYLRSIASAYPPDAGLLIWNNTQKQYVPFALSGGATMTNGGVVTLGSTTPNGPAGGDLSGSYPNPNVNGINGNAMTLEGTSSRVFRSILTTITNQTSAGSGTAFFNYLGKTANAITPKRVKFVIDGTAGTESSAEVGFFSTPNPANGSNQTLTKLVSGTVTTNFTANAVNQNTSAFSTSIPAGTNLWAGILITYSASPSFNAVGDDLNSGAILQKTSASTFASQSSYAGTVPTQSGGSFQSYLLIGTLD